VGGGRTLGKGGGVLLKKEQRSWEELTREQRLASIVWKQGFWNYALTPPYTQKDLIGSNKPFPGTKVHHGPKAAYKSVAKVKGAQLPDRINIDLGIMDLTFIRDQQGDDVKVYYKADPKQMTTSSGPSNMPEAQITSRRRYTSSPKVSLVG
jgi:hypothetical protein